MTRLDKRLESQLLCREESEKGATKFVYDFYIILFHGWYLHKSAESVIDCFSVQRSELRSWQMGETNPDRMMVELRIITII